MNSKWLFLLIVCFVFTGCHKDINKPEETPLTDILGNGPYSGEYWPTQGWRACAPEAVGMDPEKLKLVYQYAADPALKTEGIIVIKNGYIVCEAYLNGMTINTPHTSYSVAKSFASALIGIARDKGLIKSVDDKIYNFFPQWQLPATPEIKKRISIRHLLTMSAGIQWLEEDYYSANSQDDIFRMYREAFDFIQYILNKPVNAEPGTRWYYSSGESILLSGIIERTTGMKASDFAKKYLFTPLNMPDIFWESDPSGHTITGWGLHATLRQYAKFGYLYLKKGQWEGKQVVSEAWIEESTRPASEEINHYACQWWLPAAFKDYEKYTIPAGTFLGVGIYTQRLYVVPEKDLVVVRLGNDPTPPTEKWNTLQFLSLILDAIK